MNLTELKQKPVQELVKIAEEIYKEWNQDTNILDVVDADNKIAQYVKRNFIKVRNVMKLKSLKIKSY